MAAEIGGSEPVKFLGLPDVAFHEPGLGQVIVGLSVGGVKVERSLKGPDGLVRFSLLNQQASLLCELQRGQDAGIGTFLDLKPFFRSREGLGRRDRLRRRGALPQGNAQDSKQQKPRKF
jgi:hypothetical protein